MLDQLPTVQRAVRHLLDGVVDFPPAAAAGFLGAIALLVLVYYLRRGRALGPVGARVRREPARKVAPDGGGAHS